ncbi:MAG: helix-turn-helix transcriptional regulator [Clostridia bacterium]|nr:helix-turn-helix transcriptional regulator [Clostridia bacterium]
MTNKKSRYSKAAFSRILNNAKPKGMSQKDFGEKFGVGQGAMSVWLNPDSEIFPPVNNLIRIADYIGCSIDELLTGVSSDNKKAAAETGLSNDAMNYLRQSALFRESQNWTREKWKAFSESDSDGDEWRKILDSYKFVAAINNAVAHNLTDLIIDLVNYIIQDHKITEEQCSSLRKSVFKGMWSNSQEQEGDKTVIHLGKIPITALDVIDKDIIDRLAFDALEKKIIVTKNRMKESESNGQEE